MTTINRWTQIGTYGDLGVWTRPDGGKQIYVVNREQPTKTSGGYYRLASALNQKNISAWDVNFPSGQPKE